MFMITHVWAQNLQDDVIESYKVLRSWPSLVLICLWFFQFCLKHVSHALISLHYSPQFDICQVAVYRNAQYVRAWVSSTTQQINRNAVLYTVFHIHQQINNTNSIDGIFIRCIDPGCPILQDWAPLVHRNKHWTYILRQIFGEILKWNFALCKVKLLQSASNRYIFYKYMQYLEINLMTLVLLCAMFCTPELCECKTTSVL